jgi:uncharacterized protein YecT (DUF1311 family)
MRKSSSCVAFLGLFLLLMQHVVLSQSSDKEEDALLQRDKWQQADASMNEAYASLLRQAEAESNQAPAQQLKEAKESWEKFRELFCDSVSTTYGGTWTGSHYAKCKAKLALEFQESMKDYGW